MWRTREQPVQRKLQNQRKKPKRTLEKASLLCADWQHTVKTATLLKVIYRVNATFIKILTALSEMEKRQLWNPHGSTKHPEHPKQPWAKRETLGSTLFQITLQIQVIKTALYWFWTKHKHQWNRIEDPEINLVITAIWFLTKVPQTLSSGQPFQQIAPGKLDLQSQKPQQDLCLLPSKNN